MRAIRARAGSAASTLHETTAIVFHRPLPALYLAQQVLADAGVPYQALDALPLASEPYAALLDLVLAVARTGGTREAMTALLRSRLMEFRESAGDVSVASRDVAALDFALAERRSIGEADIAVRRGRRSHLAEARPSGDRSDLALRAARMAARIRAELASFDPVRRLPIR